MRRTRFLPALLLLLAVVIPADAAPAEPARPLRMLFVGNSLTEANDLPAMVTALSRAAGDTPPIETGTVALPGASLEDHLAQGDAARAIARERWDVIVLQQGPSALPESRTNLLASTRRFAALARTAGARPALYGVWPAESRRFDLDACIESYRLAAAEVDGMSFPAGRAWKAAWASDPSLPLYGPDRFHPSRLGTYLAALVIYSTVRGRSPVGLPGDLVVAGVRVTLPAAQVARAQAAAAMVTGATARPAARRRSSGR